MKNVQALPEYKLSLEFEDGVKGIIDLSHWKGKGVFSFWDDYKNFKLVELTTNKKIKWNEDIDMDPDAFYLELINKSFSEYASDQQFLWYSN